MFLSNGTPVTGPIGTLGDATPIFATANYYARNSLQLSGEWAAYAALYRTQLWVNTVIRKLAVSTARLPWGLGNTQDGAWMPAPDAPAAQLLNRPNDRLDAFSLKAWTSSIYDIYGEAYWLKLRDMDGVVRELHPMHPVNTIVHREDDGSLTYLYTAGIRQVGILPPIPEADVVPFRNFSPENMTRGLSNLESLRLTLLNEDAARRAMQSFWTRGARPAIALTHPNSLSKGAKDRLKAEFDGTHAGADHFGGTAVFEEGLTPFIMQLNAEELQYTESRKLNREEVCASYDVPPPVVHILDNATYSNITEQMRSMYRDTMAPRLEFFESVLEHHLLPDFADDVDEVRFDLDSVLRGDFETRATAVMGLVAGGIMKPNEGRPLFNLAEAGPEGDRLYANQAMQPLGTPVAGAAPPMGLPAPEQRPALPPAPGMIPTGPGRDSAAALREISALPAVRSILGRVSRCKSVAEVSQTLVSEHVGSLAPYFEQQKAAVLGATGTTGPGAVATSAPGPFDPAAWNNQLTGLLQALGVATAKASGGRASTQFGGAFDVGQMSDWIRDNAAEAARRINAATLAQLTSNLATSPDPADAVAQVYDQLTTAEVASGTPPAPAATSAPGVVLAGAVIGARLAQIAATRVKTVGGYAQHSAAEQAGMTHKTWSTGDNPRPAHAAVNGQTVPVGQLFGNGLMYPGDPSDGPDEAARCNCSLSYSREAK